MTFRAERAVFRRTDDGIETRLEITVSPEDDVEVRRLSLINHSDRPREIEVTSFVEIVLASAAPTTSPTRRSSSCSSRPSTAPSARRCCAAAARARRTSRRRGRCTC